MLTGSHLVWLYCWTVSRFGLRFLPSYHTNMSTSIGATLLTGGTVSVTATHLGTNASTAFWQHLDWTDAGMDSWWFITFANFTAILVSLESKWTCHATSDLLADDWIDTSTDSTAIMVSVIAMFTPHVTEHFWAFSWFCQTQAGLASIFISPVAILTVHKTEHVWAFNWFFAHTGVTSVVISFVAMLTEPHAPHLRTYRRNINSWKTGMTTAIGAALLFRCTVFIT